MRASIGTSEEAAIQMLSHQVPCAIRRREEIGTPNVPQPAQQIDDGGGAGVLLWSLI
jgi:hypothetical protein